MFNKCDRDQHDTSKTLTVASQSEVSMKQFKSVNCFSTIETKTRPFMIPFVVTPKKYSIIGTPYFEKYIQNINIQVLPKTSKFLSGLNL